MARLRRPGSPVALVGVHVHIGSQIFALESFEKALGALAEFFSLSASRNCAWWAASAPRM